MTVLFLGFSERLHFGVCVDIKVLRFINNRLLTSSQLSSHSCHRKVAYHTIRCYFHHL